MKITDSNKLVASFKAGDEIWACSYSLDDESKRKPMKGILSPCRYEKDYEEEKKKGSTYFNYFIPYKKDGSLSWKKAVKVYSLKYATTEDEAIEIYNDSIESHIAAHKKEIAALRKELIKVPVKSKP